VLTIHPPLEETIAGTGAALRAGRTTCVEVLERCFACIDEWEPRVKAWVVIDRDGAMNQARDLDAELAAGKCRGPLHGIPFGIKDIVDVQAMPTACGFAPWADRVASDDADVVKKLRRAGAVILGKTVTTQFAWIDPPVTRNPWDLTRTPGGSSSGSAAAVATGMCLGAVGSQTGGSVIRPASFCGVAGYKFAHQADLMRGVAPFAPSLDHLGFFARTMNDLLLARWGYEPRRPRFKRPDEDDSAAEVEDLVCRALPQDPDLSRIVLARPHGFVDRRSEAEALEAFEQALDVFKEAGAEVIDLAEEQWDMQAVLRKHRLIMAAEAAGVHERNYRDHTDEYAPHIRSLVEEGLAISAADYFRARHEMEESRRNSSDLFDDVDAIVTPATIGPAPDTSTTGNPSMNSPWSYYGQPVLTFPVAASTEGLPLSVQFAGTRYRGPVQRVAARCAIAIRRAAGAGSA
jgi:aspartyl-tRNA(Asn)/glutamyl-tRNA(Gln) amidotransferase subunit A